MAYMEEEQISIYHFSIFIGAFKFEVQLARSRA
jgi:hypothetical protein